MRESKIKVLSCETERIQKQMVMIEVKAWTKKALKKRNRHCRKKNLNKKNRK